MISAFILSISVIFCLVVFLGIIGNILLFFIAGRFRRRTQSNYIGLLALIDTVNLIFATMEHINWLVIKIGPNENAGFKQNMSDVTCKIYNFSRNTCVIISSWTIVCLTLERFMVVYMPVKLRWFTGPVKIRVIIAFIFILSGLSQTYRLVFIVHSRNTCKFQSDSMYENVIVNNVVRILCCYLLPATVIVLFNTLLLTIVNCKSVTLLQSSQNATVADSNRVTSDNSAPKNNEPSLENNNNNSNCARCQSMTTNAQVRLGQKRKRATIILLVLSFSYIIFNMPDAVVYIYFTQKIRQMNQISQRNSSSQTAEVLQLKKDMLNFFQLFFTYLHDLISLSTVISFSNNFYVYLFLGRVFRKDFTDVCSRIFSCCQNNAVVNIPLLPVHRKNANN